MGLITGGLNGRRFRIREPLPPGFRDLFLEQVRSHTFVEAPDAADDEPRIGWVGIFDPANTDIQLNDLLVDRTVSLTMRADTKRVQSAYLKIATAQRIADVCAERGVERLSKADQEAVSDAIRSELLQRAVPTVATTDFAWDIHTGEAVVFSTSETTLEHARQLIRDTFGVHIAPERTVDWLDDKLGRDEVDARLSGFVQGAPSPGDDPLEGHELLLGSDFLTWLWLQSESSDGLFRVIDGGAAKQAALERLQPDEGTDDEWNDITETLRHADLTLWIDSKLKLRDLLNDDPSTTILLGAAPSTSPEARQTLHEGKRPIEAQLGVRLGDIECMMTLIATHAGVQIAGLKLPSTVKSRDEARLIERWALLELVHTTVRQLFQQFFQARTSPAWRERVDRWMREGLEAA